uniref:Uncharacterized protein n=1 Tax=Arundo donax TaxID=35708 RepID=A0A0A9GZC6_ARUDO
MTFWQLIGHHPVPGKVTGSKQNVCVNLGIVPALCWGLMPTPSAKKRMQHYFKIK